MTTPIWKDFYNMQVYSWFPKKRLQSTDHAREWMKIFAKHFNHELKYSGIVFVTPHEKHIGRAEDILEKRKALNLEAKKKLPERWSKTDQKTR